MAKHSANERALIDFNAIKWPTDETVVGPNYGDLTQVRRYVNSAISACKNAVRDSIEDQEQ